MRLPTLTTLLLATATTLSATQVDTVITSITTLDASVQALTARVRTYKGGLLPQIPQLFGLTEVHLNTRKGYYDATALPNPLSVNDAARIIEHVNGTLSVDNPIAVSVLEGKKELFDAAGTTFAIKVGLEVLLKDHLAFSEEVLKRAPEGEEELLADGKEVVDVITVALEHGIETFS